MPLLLTVINLCIFALICLLIVLIIEWVARMFGVPENILMVVRAIFALIFLAALVAVLLGLPAAESIPNLVGRSRG